MFHNWPWTNLHQINLDWVVNTVKAWHDKYGSVENAIDNALEEVRQVGNENVEAVTGAGNSAVDAINSARDESISDMETARNGYVDSINTTGDAVLNSIPGDYSATSARANAAFTLNREYCVAIPSGSDLDAYTSPGNYVVGTAAVAGSISNIPRKVNGRLVVMQTALTNRLFQIYYTNDVDSAIYVRANTGVWREWQRLVTPSQLRKTLNILVLGNSFSQDAFAYLPPVLRELLPDYDINFGVAYEGSASIQTHVDMYNGNYYDPYDPENTRDVYTWYNYWNSTDTRWTRIPKESPDAKNLAQIMALHDWDVIYIQPTGNVSTEQTVTENIVDPGRDLLNILLGLCTKPFTPMMGQWLGVGSDGGVYSSELIKQAMQIVSRRLGINHIAPIGLAIQTARADPAVVDLGGEPDDPEGKNMLYSDGTHMQSGLPPLISAYVLALEFLRMSGNDYTGIIGPSFVPTTENCIAIGAYSTTGMQTPYPMTHGESMGLDFLMQGRLFAMIGRNLGAQYTQY